MLKNCPECGLQVSDKALTCPHCGYPLKEEKLQRIYRHSTKRRRLPNGFGQISEMKGHNLRKPFRAMVTVGKAPNGRPIAKPLQPQSYFETYNDAYSALVEYHKNPYDIDSTITMQELFTQWLEVAKTKHPLKYVKDQERNWEYMAFIHKTPVIAVRPSTIKQTLESSFIIRDGMTKKPSENTKNALKSLLNVILDYAVELGIVDHNYSKDCRNTIDYRSMTREGHISFTKDELHKIWVNIHTSYYIDMIIINCYTGWRPQELCNLELANINLENWTMIGGCKTDAGFNRLVPIHPYIRELVREKYDESLALNGKYLFNRISKGEIKFRLTYKSYNDKFHQLMKDLDLNTDHRPHDCRKTFTTLAKDAKLDEYAIKRIIGHKIDDITERIYTDRPIEWYHEEIAKISFR